ncbi:exo-beta-N-acetylmuramidase NamZ family protein [Marinihelvus fidelis]|nr:DUF1343 domain-containing protein [Marinihelvus fidelis]
MVGMVRALVLVMMVMALGAVSAARAEVLPGVEVLVRDHAAELAGKRAGILTNPTGVDRQLVSTIDVVRALPDVNVARLFGPEHGVRGQYFAGDKVAGDIDPVSGIPVASLYGATRKPTPEMLEGLDVILYDIQDIGSRSYTFVSSLTYLMEACADAGVAVWVLDRPEPMGGRVVSGPMIDDDLLSFIGIHPVPQVYGLTPGEWARMIRAERVPDIDLRVIPMDGWKRGMTYGDLDWVWVPPSQHIPRWESSYFYAMTGIIGELRRLNEGVGTPTPFELMGAPWLDSQAFAAAMSARGLEGIAFRPLTYSPRYATFSGESVQGVQLHVTDFSAVDPAAVGLALMTELVKLAPEQAIFSEYLTSEGKPTGFLKALGSRQMAEQLAANQPPAPSAEEQAAYKAYVERRKGYLLYE